MSFRPVAIGLLSGRLGDEISILQEVEKNNRAQGCVRYPEMGARRMGMENQCTQSVLSRNAKIRSASRC